MLKLKLKPHGCQCLLHPSKATYFWLSYFTLLKAVHDSITHMLLAHSSPHLIGLQCSIRLTSYFIVLVCFSFIFHCGSSRRERKTSSPHISRLACLFILPSVNQARQRNILIYDFPIKTLLSKPSLWGFPSRGCTSGG